MTFLRPFVHGWPLLLGMLLAAPSGLAGQELEGLPVAGTSACPDPAAFRSALRGLVPRGQEGAFREQVAVTLWSDGSAYRVGVVTPEKEVEKIYRDEAADCERRARIAAVFVFLTVLPPSLWGDAQEEPAEPGGAPPSPASSTSHSSLQVPPIVWLELGAAIESAPGLGRTPEMIHTAIELRTVLGRGQWAPFLAFGYAAPARFAFPELEGTLWRLPASIGGRWRRISEGWQLGFDAALHGEMQEVRATSPLHPDEAAVLRWGMRWGVSASAELSRVSPFARLQATFLPDRRALWVLPRGDVGELPRFWIGLSAGLAVGL